MSNIYRVHYDSRTRTSDFKIEVSEGEVLKDKLEDHCTRNPDIKITAVLDLNAGKWMDESEWQIN